MRQSFFSGLEASMTKEVRFLERRKKNLAVDVWATGCIMGELIRQNHTFKGKTVDDLYSNITKVIGSPSDVTYYEKWVFLFSDSFTVQNDTIVCLLGSSLPRRRRWLLEKAASPFRPSMFSSPMRISRTVLEAATSRVRNDLILIIYLINYFILIN